MGLMAPRKYADVQARLPYDLAAQLVEWHAAQVSAPAMARMLSRQTGVHMAGETVRRWLLHLTGQTA